MNDNDFAACRPDRLVLTGVRGTPCRTRPTAAAVTAHEASTAEPRARTLRGRLRGLAHVTLPGCWGALVVGCLSFTPSLLPRGGLVQGLIWGITAAIGYGLGVVAAWVWRAFADRDPRPPRRRRLADLPGRAPRCC